MSNKKSNFVGTKFICAKCGSPNILVALWAPINKVEPLPGAKIHGVEVPGIAPVETIEPLLEICDVGGAWCPDCGNETEAKEAKEEKR